MIQAQALSLFISPGIAGAFLYVRWWRDADDALMVKHLRQLLGGRLVQQTRQNGNFALALFPC